MQLSILLLDRIRPAVLMHSCIACLLAWMLAIVTAVGQNANF